MRIDIPFGIQSYTQEAKQLSSQRMINCYLEQQEGGSKNIVAVFRTPGIETQFTLPEGPVRGGLVHKGLPHFVSGEKLYSVSDTFAQLGDIPGAGRVDMISNGSQLGILANQDLYVYEATVDKVTDPGFGGAISATYADLFGVFAKPGSQDFFINNPGAPSFPDLTDYDALDFATAEALPGNIVAVISDHREVFVFKEESAEVWTNTGNADFPFQSISNAFIELGCIAKHSIAKADNTIFWLANDMTIRKADGYVPVRVSTHVIENDITKMAKRSDAYALSHAFNGHLFYVITFPSEGRTYVYDITTGLWHERASQGIEWAPAVCLYANDRTMVGDSKTGRIGVISNQVHSDFDQPHILSITSPPVHKEMRQIFFKRLQIDFQMGSGLGIGQGSDPQAMLEWSDDGGLTWSSEYWRSLGRIGEYRKRAVWNRLGASRQRVFRLTFSDPVPFTMIQAWADVEIGTA